ncbi:MAG: thioredoxin family protein [Campylobacterota bacterium]|nr:thioredoxin family protein [Campylobacterota bacterium]
MKLLFGISICMVMLFAIEGKVVYEKKCASCHEAFIPMEKLMENFMEKNNTLLYLKAPTLNQLSFRLKQQIGDPKGDEDMHRMEVGAFIADYLNDPDKQKSVCLPDVIKYFETMPSMKGQLSDDETEAVSEFLYDYESKLIKQKSIAYESFDAAMKRAAKEDKIVMIKATSKHCRYCKKMDREVLLEDEVVQSFSKDFIAVSVDVSNDTLPLDLKASMTPTFFFIFVDKDKTRTKRVPGAWNKEDFLEILKEAKIAKRSQK